MHPRVSASFDTDELTRSGETALTAVVGAESVEAPEHAPREHTISAATGAAIQRFDEVGMPMTLARPRERRVTNAYA